VLACLTLSAFTGAVAGLLLVGRIGSAQPSAAGDMLLNGIAAVVLGGTSLFGGEGGVKNTLVGLLIFGTVADGFPIVSLDRDIDSPDVPLVRLDNRGGARQATAHLLELGHRAIAHVTGPQRLELSRERLAGYTGALKSAGVAYDRLVIESDFTELGGYDSVRALLASGVEFSALFCGNDLMAVGAMNALLESGHAVPADVSVMGFDDLPLASYTTPRLTTLHQPAAELGEQAAALLIDVIRGRRRAAKAGDVVLNARLVERASTGPPRSAGRKRR
jgi:DNA-binding LacI/PurR family transcriptional regulator